MNKKLQVFISSTYIDLVEERQAAVQAILGAGHIPAGMELFKAGDETQLETIKTWIDESDVYLLILGGRYGSIEPGSGKSYTQLEYEYALNDLKMPVFSVVITEKALQGKIAKFIADGRTAGDATEMHQPQKYKEFNGLVKSKVCEFFEDTKDIQMTIYKKMAEYNKREDLAGWISGRELLGKSDPEDTLLAELRILQEENAKLALLLSPQKVDLENGFASSVSSNEIKSVLQNNHVYFPESKFSIENGTVDAFSLFLEHKQKLINGISWNGNLNIDLQSKLIPLLDIFGLIDKTTSTNKLSEAGRSFLIRVELDRIENKPQL